MNLLKYIYASTGQKEAVIIPINIWERIKAHIKISSLLEPAPTSSISILDLEGMLSGKKIDAAFEAQQLRDEWERDF